MQITLEQAKAIFARECARNNLFGWRIKIDGAKRRRGNCNHGTKTISVSKHLLAIGEQQVASTILHEIAHALVGPGHGHDYVWRNKARQIGTNPNRCGAPMNTEPTYIGECLSCGYISHRYRSSRNIFAKWIHKNCGGDIFYKKVETSLA